MNDNEQILPDEDQLEFKFDEEGEGLLWTKPTVADVAGYYECLKPDERDAFWGLLKEGQDNRPEHPPMPFKVAKSGPSRSQGPPTTRRLFEMWYNYDNPTVKFGTDMITLRCNCSEFDEPHWAAITNSPNSIAQHWRNEAIRTSNRYANVGISRVRASSVVDAVSLIPKVGTVAMWHGELMVAVRHKVYPVPSGLWERLWNRKQQWEIRTELRQPYPYELDEE